MGQQVTLRNPRSFKNSASSHNPTVCATYSPDVHITCYGAVKDYTGEWPFCTTVRVDNCAVCITQWNTPFPQSHYRIDSPMRLGLLEVKFVVHPTQAVHRQ